MFLRKGFLFFIALVLPVLMGQVSASSNVNATLSLDLIPNGGAGNQRDDGVTSGTVSSRGTKIAVEVFANGVTTPLVGLKVEFDFDASVLKFEKAENSAFLFAIPEATGTNFASGTPVTLPASGFLVRAEFTTVVDVTGREFFIGIKRVFLSDRVGLENVVTITTADKIAFNAPTSTPDFDGDGMVGFADFLQLAGVFGSSRGDGTYQSKYDLDGDGAIGFPDFLIFTNDFGKPVSPPSGNGGGGSPGPSSGFAPADQLAFNSLFIGKRLLASTFFIDFESAGRFREEVPGVGTATGSYTYSNTGPNTGTLIQNYDEGVRCTNQLTFNSTAAGTLRYTYDDGTSGSDNWQISESGDDHSNTRSGATRLRWGVLDSIQVIQVDDPGYIEAAKSGRIETGTDVDYFSVQVTGYGVLTVYTTGDLDTYGALQNSSGSTLATDDDGASGNNFGINYVVNSGTYYIKVEGYGSDTGSYTMNALFNSDDSNIWVGATALSWSVLNTSGSLGIDRTGWIENRDDKDYFKVQVSKPGVLTVFTTGNRDTRGRLLPIGNGDVPYVLVSDDDSGSGNNFGIVSQVFPGTYYIEVQGYNTGSYDLHVRFEADQESTSGTSEGNFNIELVFVNDNDFTSSQKAVFRQAARHWMSIITEDLRDTDFSTNPYNEWDADLGTRIRVNDTVDDLRIFIRATSIDGSGDTLGRAGPFWIRGDTYLPILGKIWLDTADLQRIDEEGILWPVVLHEMGHVLGIGALWKEQDLLRGSSNRYFIGPLSIQAFNNAGGRNYNGAKVPTESDGSHWRESVLGAELMTPRYNYDANPLSAITIQSLADLGYRVDVSQADRYSLPAPISGKLVGDQSHDWGDCSLKGPIYVSDEKGRIIHIIEK